MLAIYVDMNCGASMNTRHWAIGCLIGGWLALTPVQAENITWLSADFPPLAMPGANQAQQGYMDKLLQQVRNKLPQHQFSEEVVPWPRVLFMAQSGGPYCTAMAAHTPERDEFLRFTVPYGYVYPVGVVARAQDKELFSRFVNPDGELRLRDVLRSAELRIGVAAHRTYGTKIDNMLGSLLQSAARQVLTVHQDNSTKSLIGMLKKKRFDYTLAYPGEAVFYDSPQAGLHFYPIAGNSDLLAGRFSCTKSAQTDRSFEDLNRLALSMRKDSTLLGAYERWLPPYLVQPFRARLERQLASPQP